MLQAPEPDTFVLATNRTETVRDFVRMAFRAVDIELDFRGKGVDEQAVDRRSGKTLVRINPEVLPAGRSRPADWQSRPRPGPKLGWEPRTTLEELCRMMVEADLRRNTRGVSF